MYLLKTFANPAGIALENARLRQEAVEKQRLRHGIVRGQTDTDGPSPCEDPTLAGLDCGWIAKTGHGGLRGLFSTTSRLGAKKLAVVVGDISGKGVPAGLLMAGSRSSLRTKMEARPPCPKPFTR